MSLPAPRARFQDYWRRLGLREQAMTISAPCITWRRTDALNEVERFVWERVRGARRLLDFGAGDQALRRKLLAAGFAGSYETYDASPEFPTTYQDPGEIEGVFDAVLCLEVLEHLPLEEGLALRERLLAWTAPGGWLIISTPNPACVLSPFSRDETHVHLYPLHDLLAWALAAGLAPEARRVKFLPPRLTLVQHLRLQAQRVLCYLIGADRADGLVMAARRPAGV